MSENSTVIAEAYRQVELRLQSQLSAALAADQRALGLAGMLVAAAAIVAGLASAAHWGAGMFIGASGLGVAALVAWLAARPTDFYMPGALFADFAEDIKASASVGQVQAALGDFHDKHCVANDATLKKNARLVNASIIMAVFSLAFVITGQLYCIAA